VHLFDVTLLLTLLLILLLILLLALNNQRHSGRLSRLFVMSSGCVDQVSLVLILYKVYINA
jgi:hypothetical protein